MNRRICITGALLGVLGICLGAFAAHGLEPLISEDSLRSFETGIRYQIYHAFLLLLLGSTNIVKSKWKPGIFYLVLIGVVFFSFSIYGLATNDLSSFDFKQIALITPFGGLLLILGWVLLLLGIVKGDRNLTK
jgi:uncharacterized membrane protein YgdD (TMEM256/DUF423 family)